MRKKHSKSLTSKFVKAGVCSLALTMIVSTTAPVYAASVDAVPEKTVVSEEEQQYDYIYANRFLSWLFDLPYIPSDVQYSTSVGVQSFAFGSDSEDESNDNIGEEIESPAQQAQEQPAEQPTQDAQTEPVEPQAQAQADVPNSIGHVIIPDVGLDFPIVRCRMGESQPYIDAGYAALFTSNAGIPTIAAHQNLGFYKMRSCTPGMYAYVDGTRYVCTDIFAAHNQGPFLTDDYGNVAEKGPLQMYTCNGADWRNITITVWTVA